MRATAATSTLYHTVEQLGKVSSAVTNRDIKHFEETLLPNEVPTWVSNNPARLSSDVATEGCSGPRAFSFMANDRL